MRLTTKQGVISIVVQGECRKQGQRLLPSVPLSVAYEPSTASTRELARKHNIVPATVSYLKILVASAYLAQQLLAFQSVAYGFINTRTDALRPSRIAFASCIQFDSTQAKMSIRIDDDLTLLQQRSTWHLLVTLARSRFVSVPVDSTDPACKMRMEHVVAPVVMVGNSSECLYDALSNCPSGKQLESEVALMQEHADLAFRNYSRDYAKKCTKAVNYTARVDLADTQVSDMPCTCHKPKHVSDRLSEVAPSGLPLQGRLYSMSLLLKQNGYGVRLYQAVGKHLAQDLKVDRSADPPIDAVAYADELIDYLADQVESAAGIAKHDSNLQKPKKKKPPRADAVGSNLRGNLRKLFDAMGCRWWESAMVHYCRGLTCWCGGDRDAAVKRIKQLILQTIVSSLPPSPASIKWTKLGPCLDWHIGVFSVCRMLGPLYDIAMGDMSVLVHKINASKRKDGVVEDEINWHEVVGKRMEKSKATVNSDDDRYSTLSLGIAIEAIRWFINWVLRACLRKKSQDSQPPILDIVSTSHTPLRIVSHYFATLLSGSSSRLILIWRQDHCDSFAEWCQQFPERSQQLRDLILVGDAWFHRKVVQTFLCWPWVIAKLADPRETVEARTSIASLFLAMELCCLDEFFCRRLRMKLPPGIAAADLVTYRFLIMALLAWAWCVDVAASSVENQHALNRSLEGMACENVMSGYVNRESQTVKLCREFVGPTPDLDSADAYLATDAATDYDVLNRQSGPPPGGSGQGSGGPLDVKHEVRGPDGRDCLHLSPLEAALANRVRKPTLKEASLCRRGLTYTVSLDFRGPTL